MKFSGLDLHQDCGNKNDAEDSRANQMAGALASGVVSPSHDMVTASPAVSPNVVARILMIQNASVTCGTLLTMLLRFESRVCIRLHSYQPCRAMSFVMKRVFGSTNFIKSALVFERAVLTIASAMRNVE